MVKVSIIVPVYNVEKYIKRCLSSLINQTLEDIEIICVNDGSTDKSLDILEEFAPKDSRIIVISQQNQGLSAARNSGLKVANGEYIGFVDSDDWVDLDFIEKLYNSAIKNDCDIAAATIIRKRESSQKYRVHYEKEEVFESLEDKINVCDIPRCCYVWNKLYKKELIENKPFKVSVAYEDVLWTPDILKLSNRLVTVPNINYYYRATKGSIVKTYSSKKQNDSYKAKKYIISFFKENGLPLSKKAKTLTKEIKYLLNIPIIRIKEYEGVATYYLFNFIPFFRRKANG